MSVLHYTTRLQSNEEKQQLLAAGVGGKKPQLARKGNANDVMVDLKETFPKLNDSGGYEFTRMQNQVQGNLT